MKRNEIAKLNSAQAATNRFGIGMLTPTLIVLLAPGENRHSGPGENRQFWPGENRQSLFTI